jgi:hypothetical protein
MPTNNAWNSNVPVEISKGGTNATSMTNTDGVCYFDGTRVVTTTVGNTTEVLTSNGAGVAPTFQPIPSSGVQVLSVKRKITSQEIKAINGTPITLINAPGANKIISVISCCYKYVYGGSNVFTAAASQSIGVYYTGDSVNIFGAAIVPNSTLIQTNSMFGVSPSGSKLNVSVGDVDNQGIMIKNPNATEISGNAANDNYIMIQLFYFISDSLA